MYGKRRHKEGLTIGERSRKEDQLAGAPPKQPLRFFDWNGQFAVKTTHIIEVR